LRCDKVGHDEVAATVATFKDFLLVDEYTLLSTRLQPCGLSAVSLGEHPVAEVERIAAAVTAEQD
jgi:hypothetical protein